MLLCDIMCSYLSMESDVSNSRPHFYSLLHIRLTAHTLIYPPHYIHIPMLIHNFILVRSLILFLKHTWASHFFHTFEHSYTSHLVYKIFFVITFSSQCDLHSSFSSLACISARTLVSIRNSSTTTSGYNILTICSILYLNYIISMLCIFIWLLHLCLSREPYLFEAIRNVPKCSKYFALNIWTSSEMF